MGPQAAGPPQFLFLLCRSPPQIPEEFRNLEPIWRKLNKASLDQVGGTEIGDMSLALLQVAMKRENRTLLAENIRLQVETGKGCKEAVKLPNFC